MSAEAEEVLQTSHRTPSSSAISRTALAVGVSRGRRARTGDTSGALFRPSINGSTTELIGNGVSIEADAVLGLTARIQRFGGYATDEAALAPEPFDAHHHWSGSSRSIWSTSLSALGALEEVERGRRETVVLSDR